MHGKLSDQRRKQKFKMNIVQETPQWALNVMQNNDGVNLQFFGGKVLTQSDMQGRFLFRKVHVENVIRPQLLADELIAANLAPLLDFMNVGDVHDGLPISLYTQDGFRFAVVLHKRNSNNSAVLKGNWGDVVQDGRFQVGDDVQLWSFRKADENGILKLCLVIGK